MILKAILQGLGLGLTLAIFLGPSFFALIQTSTKSGFRSGLALATGIFFSDVFCVLLAYLGVAQLFDNPQNKTFVGIIGGTILVMFGFFSIFQRKKVETETIEIKALKYSLFITKGFFLNLLNPFVIILWSGWVGLVSSNIEYTHIHITLFFASSLLTVFITDVLKAYSANKISRLLNPRILRMANIIAGIIIAVSGFVLIYRVF